MQLDNRYSAVISNICDDTYAKLLTESSTKTIVHGAASVMHSNGMNILDGHVTTWKRG